MDTFLLRPENMPPQDIMRVLFDANGWLKPDQTLEKQQWIIEHAVGTNPATLTGKDLELFNQVFPRLEQGDTKGCIEILARHWRLTTNQAYETLLDSIIPVRIVLKAEANSRRLVIRIKDIALADREPTHGTKKLAMIVRPQEGQFTGDLNLNINDQGEIRSNAYRGPDYLDRIIPTGFQDPETLAVILSKIALPTIG